MTKLLVIVGFLISFAAGLVVGLVWHGKLPGLVVVGGDEAPSPPLVVDPPATQPVRTRGSFLSAELGLTPQQQEQLKKIWSETASRGWRDHDDRRRQFRQERDEAILGLVSPEDREKYDQIQKAYSERTSALEREGREAYQTAVARTKEILTPPQREKYEEWLKRNERERGGRDRERRENKETTAPGASATPDASRGGEPQR